MPTRTSAFQKGADGRQPPGEKISSWMGVGVFRGGAPSPPRSVVLLFIRASPAWLRVYRTRARGRSGLGIEPVGQLGVFVFPRRIGGCLPIVGFQLCVGSVA